MTNLPTTIASLKQMLGPTPQVELWTGEMPTALSEVSGLQIAAIELAASNDGPRALTCSGMAMAEVTGTARHYKIRGTGGRYVLQGSVGLPHSAADMLLDRVNIAAEQTITVNITWTWASSNGQQAIKPCPQQSWLGSFLNIFVPGDMIGVTAR